MSLLKKTTFILLLAFLLGFIAIFLVSKYHLLKSFEILERDSAVASLRRIEKNLAEQIETIDQFLRDWAFWDDSYAFVQNPDRDYIVSNLPPATFANLNLDLIGFFDARGRPVYLVAYDGGQRTVGAPAAEVADFLQKHPRLVTLDSPDSVRKGIVLLPRAPLLFSSRPILTSGRLGPVQGCLFFGRYLDDQVIARLSAQNQVELTVQRLDREVTAEMVEYRRAGLANPGKIIIEPTAEKNRLCAYTLIDDFFGKPALLLKVILSRSILAMGHKTVNVLYVIRLVIGLVFIALVLLLLENQVLGHIRRFKNQVALIGEQYPRGKRLAIAGPGEIRNLAASVNTMLDAIDRFQQELATMQERYRSLVDGINEGFFQTDRQGRFTFANRALAQIFSVADAGALVGRNFLHFVAAAGREQCREIFQPPAPAAGPPPPVRVPIITAGRQTRIIEVRPTAVLENNQFAGVMGAITDITEQRATEDELRRHRDHLEELVMERTTALTMAHRQLLHAEKLSAIGSLAASIAHEFNNPLCGIMNVLEGVKKRTTLEEEDAQLVDIAITECDRMKNLVKDLQNFNQPTSGRMAPLDIHTCLDSILQLSKKNLKNRRIAVRKDYAANLPPALAVADQIKQVVLNLLNNAADACEGGGEIIISTGVQDRNIVLQVQDNGRGIAPEHINRIFEPFFTTKPDAHGTGLGLSVSYGIIKNHGGEIKVTSRVGKGSTFTVTLPTA